MAVGVKYDLGAMRSKCRDHARRRPEPTDAGGLGELASWDPFGKQDGTPPPAPKSPHMMDAPKVESPYDRKLRMLRQLKAACYACTMCELGTRYAEKDGRPELRDPHVFSNLNPKRFMIVGRNPGWEDVEACEPFAGQSGVHLDRELTKNGLSRDDFYMCNVNRCWTKSGAEPTDGQTARCSPFLEMEINLIKPRLLIGVGAGAFESLCPGVKFEDAVGGLTASRFGVKVFAVQHPGGSVDGFIAQMRVACGLVRRLMNGRDA